MIAKIDALWASTGATVLGVLMVLCGLVLFVFAPKYHVPVGTITLAANALINAGALLITPRKKQ